MDKVDKKGRQTNQNEIGKKGKGTSYSSHDQFFRRIFSQVKYARELLSLVLAKRLLQRLDLDTLQPEKETHIHEGTERRMDALFSARLKDSAQTAQIILLIEHKSFNDSQLMQQLLEYQTVIYRQQTGPVIPIVVYHGKEKFSQKPLTFQGFLPFSFSAAPELSEYALNFKCCFLNIQELDIYRGAQGLNCASFLFIIKKIRGLNEPTLGEFFKLFGSLDWTERKAFINEVVTYINGYNVGYTPERLKEIEAKYIKNESERSLPVYESFLEKESRKSREEGLKLGLEQGLEKGIEEGLEEGMAKGREVVREMILRLIQEGIDIETISKCTELSPNEVEELHQERLASRK